MRFLLVVLGLLAALFLVPIFKNLYDTAILPMTVDVNNAFLQVVFVSIPYLIPIVIGILAFLMLRRREPQ